jgi:hypothetical protein
MGNLMQPLKREPVTDLDREVRQAELLVAGSYSCV